MLPHSHDEAQYVVMVRKSRSVEVVMEGAPILEQLREAIEDEIKSRARAGDYRIDRAEIEDIGARV